MFRVADANEPRCYSEFLRQFFDFIAQTDVRPPALTMENLDPPPRDVTCETCPSAFATASFPANLPA